MKVFEFHHRHWRSRLPFEGRTVGRYFDAMDRGRLQMDGNPCLGSKKLKVLLLLSCDSLVLKMDSDLLSSRIRLTRHACLVFFVKRFYLLLGYEGDLGRDFDIQQRWDGTAPLAPFD